MDWREENKLKQKAQEYYEKEFSYNQVYIQGYSDGYAKAIDELKNKVCMHFADWKYSEDDKCIKDLIELASESVDEIAEQLKAGAV